VWPIGNGASARCWKNRGRIDERRPKAKALGEGDAEAWDEIFGELAKIIYDRNAAEVRVIGRARGGRYERAFPVATELSETLKRVQEYVREQNATGQ